MNTIAYFEIQSDDPAAAGKFYETIFGWKFARDPKIPIEYYRTETANMRGAILKRPVPAPPPGGTNAFVCSMEVSSFDATAEKILAHKGRVALPKFAIPGTCWQGYFLDPDGNTFGIFEADASAA